ncbi:hypothetical protein DL764_000850 [Monosporascus ibericus]|uniref:Uncharacterized protein n=1 Tax=Monosporascus ibericus TaxID=155417 RepID=A0A4Q4TWY0_9PEZI|nr:hypothetical protein DL764_000850 [Monosporascus ibericus]
MVGLGWEGTVSDRLIEAKSAESAKSSAAHDRFGRVRILLMGGFNQPPPVFNKPVFYTTALGSSALAQLQQANRNAYMDMSNTAARSMSCTREHWELLSTRYRGNLSGEEITSLSDVGRVYLIQHSGRSIQFRDVDELGWPVLCVKATGTGDRWGRPSSRNAGNLDIFIPVCVGARMMPENICVSWTYVNGALGTVEDIVWNNGVD